MKKILKIFIIVISLIAFALIVRFVFGGSEDSWICSAGEWIKHGNPSAPMPVGTCD